MITKKNNKIYYESFEEAIERNRKKIHVVHKKLKAANVKYVMYVVMLKLPKKNQESIFFVKINFILKISAAVNRFTIHNIKQLF